MDAAVPALIVMAYAVMVVRVAYLTGLDEGRSKTCCWEQPHLGAPDPWHPRVHEGSR